MRALYNLLFTIGFILSSPYYFLKMWRRGHWREKFGERFARYSSRTKQAITNRHILWLHAVSVGEVNICTQLIRALEPRLPNIKILVSTTTSTGMGELEKRLPRHIEKVYYPIDQRGIVQRAIRILSPEAVVLVEAEIWPNFLWRLEEKGIPVFLVNARMSEPSYRGYKRFGFVFKPVFASFTGVGVQNEADAQRMRELGCRPEAISVVGNLKFDAAQLHERPLLDVKVLLRQLGVKEGAPIIVGGSTHAGEESLLAEIFLRLRAVFPELFLVLVPRHFERGKEIGKELTARRVEHVFRTQISTTTQFTPGEVACLLVNTTGELKYFYQAASVIFVGKSLTAEGGQNPIEPGILGKAMVFGPNMQNFKSISSELVSEGGAVQVRDANELEGALRELLGDEQKRSDLGTRAQRVVQRNLGAIERTAAMIQEHLRWSGVHTSPSSRA